MRFAVCTLADLAPDYVLAPERHVLAGGAATTGDGVPLGELVVERRERIDPSAASEGSKQARGRDRADAVVLDTSHARDGILDVAGALRDGAGGKSAKKRALPGDLVVSRLRPYLRQIALVHPSAVALAGGRPVALSTEFYVLAPRIAGDDLAFLVPFLLSKDAQSALASAQEGGHHPRVPRSSLFALRVPRSLLRTRVKTSRAVTDALAETYRASSRLRALLEA
ncbi:MAG: hypothetical protein JWO86_2217 [Myxococcaceae bacterium]|nr:hypothetical protein [Myxococcaceae bacterium]